ncbi:MAG TPA: LON peptidase substrate-binding domain-containing protein [Gemmatales bacterium]|nr:LON peptidase substrate-binding domain-containing protein [Gemmatales bacterium]HMP60185.1 LON peptidase substrate-binding domain-containing protein [Gemmatales bacterium]
MALTADDLEEFGGIAPLFPLPNFIMLPHVVQPFHMFEPRYRALTADAIAGDRFLAIAVFEPGWEEDYNGAPPLRPIACLARILNHQQTAEGTYNLLIRGVCRARLGKELLASTLYRQAEATPLADPVVPTTATLRAELAAAADPWLPSGGPAQEQFLMLLESNLSLGALVDVISFALPVPGERKQLLLETIDLHERYALLLETLRSGPEGRTPAPTGPRRYPPEFSNN